MASLVGVTNRVLVIDPSKMLYVLLSRMCLSAIGSSSGESLDRLGSWVLVVRLQLFVEPAASHLVFAFLLDR